MYAADDSGTVLVQRLMVHWRVRCVLRRAPIEATAGSAALDLCAAIVTTLERGAPPPGLARAVRTWGAGLRSADEAVAAAQCLSEITTELSADVFQNFPSAALEPVLELLATEAAAASARLAERQAGASSLSDRKALERDLDEAVAASLLSNAEAALAVIELDAAPKGSLHRPRDPQADDAAVLALGAALAGAGGPGQRVYRLSRRKLAVLAPGTHTVDLGAVVLEATLALGIGFSWGMAGLRASGADVLTSPDVLVMLAEADLHLRRRDYVHARHMLSQHRRRSALASVSAALLLLAGTAFGLGAFRSAPQGQGQLAAPARLGTTPSAPSSPGPSVVLPTPPSLVPGGGNQALSTQTPVVPAVVNHVTPPAAVPPVSTLPPAVPPVTTPPPPSPPATLTGTVHQIVGTAKGLVRKLTGGLPPGIVNTSNSGKGHLAA
jgi:GGDEF domain-containing protein